MSRKVEVSELRSSMTTVPIRMRGLRGPSACIAYWSDRERRFVVLEPGAQATEDELKAHVKSRLAPFKYPRWIEFVTELPKTATGKIQRFRLR